MAVRHRLQAIVDRLRIVTIFVGNQTLNLIIDDLQSIVDELRQDFVEGRSSPEDVR